MYSRPDKNSQENTTYNYHVSCIRICSEHCVGFLKGRWSSLCGLRVRIDSVQDKSFATLWVISCIHLHNFALMHEQGMDMEADQFYITGVQLMEEERVAVENWQNMLAEQLFTVEDDDEVVSLLEGRLKREMLKEALFSHLDATR